MSNPAVLFVIGGLGAGGSETQLAQVVLRANRGEVSATVAVINPSSDRRLLGLLERAGVTVRVLGASRAGRPARFGVAFIRLLFILLRERPDVVYAWLEESSLLARPACGLTHIPLVVARRNVCGSVLERHAPLRWLIRGSEASAQVVTGNSSAVIEEAIRRGVPRERTRLVANGHLPAEAQPMPEGEPVVLGYLANLRREKGHARLLEALERVRTRTPWRVDLGGEGPMRPAIEAEIAARGLGGRVRLVGHVDDPASFWEERAVALLLSDHEGMPNVLVEAALAGRPAIATAAGGTPEAVSGDGAILVPLEAPDAIAGAITSLVEDPTARARMGAAAQRHANENFSLERSVAGHLAALREARAYPAAIPQTDALGRYRATLERLGIPSKRYEIYLGRLWRGVPLEGRRLLDVGGGSGLIAFYAALMGARVVCLEPSAEGSNPGMESSFAALAANVGGAVTLDRRPLQELDSPPGSFDVILLHNSVNHLDEPACEALPADPEARRTFRDLFGRLHDLASPGGDLVMADCARRNLFGMLGVRNPLVPSIEWRLHQQPRTWAELLLQEGWTDIGVSWNAPTRAGRPGELLLANPIGAFLTQSHFTLKANRP